MLGDSFTSLFKWNPKPIAISMIKNTTTICL